MKRRFAMVLALCLICGAALAADENADRVISEDQGTGDTTVKYNVPEIDTFTVVIPASIILTKVDDATGAAEQVQNFVAVRADAINIPGFKIIVTLEASRNDFKLMNPADTDGANAIDYTVTNCDTNTVLKEKDEIFTWECIAPQPSDSTPPQLDFAAPAIADCKLAGDYTDTLTFKVTVEDPRVTSGGSGEDGGDIDLNS